MGSKGIQLKGFVELDRKLAELIANTEGALEAAAEIGAGVIEELAESRAPGPHIEKEKAGKGNSKTRVNFEIGPDKEHFYYTFFERGTAPHTIRGKPILAFEGSNDVVFVRVVQHPGMGARPFLRPAFDEGKDETIEKVGKAMKNAIMKVVK